MSHHGIHDGIMIRRERLHLFLRVIATILSVLVTIALVRAIRRDGPAALDAWRAADVRWTWITISIASGLSGHAALIVGWRRLLKDSRIPISLWQAARLTLVSNLGRYLPAAKAWQMGIIAIIAAENNLPATRVAASSLFYGLVGVVVGAILLFWTGSAALGVQAAWLAVPLSGVVGLVAAPAVLNLIPSLRNIIVQRVPGLESVTAWTMWALVWTCALSWVAWGMGLYALALGLMPQAGASVAVYISAWVGPFLAGVASIVAPAGLGVRDEVMRTMLVTSGVNASGAIVVVLVARIWATALEVVPAVVCLALRPRSRQRATATDG
jgi:glycosyltransferase 2 family protein